MTKNKKIEWPASRVEMWPIDKIQEYPKNPRTHPQAQIDLIADSMKSEGVTAPILVDERGVIIYGHGRRLAALQNGFKKYPVAVAKGWTEKQKTAARIKDNSYGLMSGWDDGLMQVVLTQLKFEEYPMELLGFQETQLAQFLNPVVAQQPGISLAEQFGIVPFSVLSARDGIWQDRKRAWLALGIQSEIGRGETSSTSARVGEDDVATYRPIGGHKRKPNAIPGGGGDAARPPTRRQADR